MKPYQADLATGSLCRRALGHSSRNASPTTSQPLSIVRMIPPYPRSVDLAIPRRHHDAGGQHGNSPTGRPDWRRDRTRDRRGHHPCPGSRAALRQPSPPRVCAASHGFGGDPKNRERNTGIHDRGTGEGRRVGPGPSRFGLLAARHPGEAKPQRGVAALVRPLCQHPASPGLPRPEDPRPGLDRPYDRVHHGHPVALEGATGRPEERELPMGTGDARTAVSLWRPGRRAIRR